MYIHKLSLIILFPKWQIKTSVFTQPFVGLLPLFPLGHLVSGIYFCLSLSFLCLWFFFTNSNIFRIIFSVCVFFSLGIWSFLPLYLSFLHMCVCSLLFSAANRKVTFGTKAIIFQSVYWLCKHVTATTGVNSIKQILV